MTTLYTAVGRFERRADEYGRQYPVVIINYQEYMVDIPEMIIWTCLNWRLLDLSQVHALYEQRIREINDIGYTSCENYVERLIQRGLIVSGIGSDSREALYDLLCNLYVVPLASNNIFLKITGFLKFTLFDGMPFHKAKDVFRKEKLSNDEKRIIALVKQTWLSTAEIIKCIETGVYDLSGDGKIMSALYDDDFTTSDNIGYYAELFRNQQLVLVTVANLYLRKLIMFERI